MPTNQYGEENSASEPRQAPLPKLSGYPYPKGENAFAYLGQVQRELRRAGANVSQIEIVTKDMQSSDYDHLYDAYLDLF